ncbi:MAG: hypothetical protein R3B48_16560 [Kofleriaceae bacterium]
MRWPPWALLTPVSLFLPAAALEMAVNRLAVPLLRPSKGVPPLWHTALDYAGLFVFYFASLLGVILVGIRVARAIRGDSGWGARAAWAPLAALGLLSAWAVIGEPSVGLTFAIEVCFATATVVSVGRGLGHVLGRPRDLGAVIGVLALSVPLLLHFVAAVGGRYVWPEQGYDGAGATVTSAGVLALALGALTSPYCLAPRPFVRAVTRLAPVLASIGVAVAAALLLRADYLGTVRAVKLAVGVELQTTRADPQLTLYLLALATMTWTVTSCAIAPTAPRRRVALGLLMLVLGGYGFQWPLHYLLLALGLTEIADAAEPVRAAERRLVAIGPSVDDATWGRYLGAVSALLRARCSTLHVLTARGEDVTTSLLVGEADGRNLRVRLDRDGGVVVGLDVVIGRDLEPRASGAAATLTVRRVDVPPFDELPVAGPRIESGDLAFDRAFLCRGAEPELRALFDESSRDRAIALLDGWLVSIAGQSLRYRSYPGSPRELDALIPLEDLAQGRVPAGAAPRAMVLLELLLELAARGQIAAVERGADPEPSWTDAAASSSRLAAEAPGAVGGDDE